MLLLLGAILAGMLTVLAPCVLPLLPIIIGGSLTGDNTDKKRPVIITLSLASSLILFTLLLKVTTLLINIPPQAITIASGSLIIAIGILMLFPLAYAMALGKLGIEHRAQSALSKGFQNKRSYIGPILTGAALGPVFSSCSPVYAYILATILPVNFLSAFAYILAYVFGLALVLLLIGYYGQRFIRRIKFASNPKGWFQRSIAIIFIIVGLLVATGYDKRLQTWVSAHTPFNFDKLSSQLIPGTQKNVKVAPGVLNVQAYDAPEFTGLENWINSDPLTVKQLKGKVVLVDFWTYSCINCIRNNPYLEQWYETYKDQGFVIVGVHAPEFAFEMVPANVQKGVKDQKITYPVALDNNLATWNAYNNQYWPAGYLIDAEGKIRRVHYGEGQYKESEQAIRALLQEKGANVDKVAATKADDKLKTESGQTPETYMGSSRASNYSGTPALAAAPQATFTPAIDLEKNHWTLSGGWKVDSEKITATGNSALRFRMSSKEAYLVASGAGVTQPVSVLLNGKAITSTSAGSDVSNGQVLMNESKLYRLVSHKTYNGDYLLELRVPIGVSLNAFTFGS